MQKQTNIFVLTLLLVFICFTNVYCINFLYNKYKKSFQQEYIFNLNTISDTMSSILDFLILVYILSNVLICSKCTLQTINTKTINKNN